MTTNNHNLPYPSEGSYVDDFIEIAEEVDELVIITGSLSDRPSPTGSDAIFVDIGGTEGPDSEAVMYADLVIGNTPEWVIVDLPIAQDLSNVARIDEEETIRFGWSFDIDIDADLDGLAEYAVEADHADHATEAPVVGGLTPDQFVENVDGEVINVTYTFASEQVFRSGIDVQERLGIPTYG